MNPALHHYAIEQHRAQVEHDACRGRHHLADLPARERRLSGYGARLLGFVRRPRPAAVLRPAPER